MIFPAEASTTVPGSPPLLLLLCLSCVKGKHDGGRNSENNLSPVYLFYQSCPDAYSQAKVKALKAGSSLAKTVNPSVQTATK